MCCDKDGLASWCTVVIDVRHSLTPICNGVDIFTTSADIIDDYPFAYGESPA